MAPKPTKPAKPTPTSPQSSSPALPSPQRRGSAPPVLGRPPLFLPSLSPPPYEESTPAIATLPDSTVSPPAADLFTPPPQNASPASPVEDDQLAPSSPIPTVATPRLLRRTKRPVVSSGDEDPFAGSTPIIKKGPPKKRKLLEAVVVPRRSQSVIKRSGSSTARTKTPRRSTRQSKHPPVLSPAPFIKVEPKVKTEPKHELSPPILNNPPQLWLRDRRFEHLHLSNSFLFKDLDRLYRAIPDFICGACSFTASNQCEFLGWDKKCPPCQKGGKSCSFKTDVHQLLPQLNNLLPQVQLADQGTS
jgi:hypothetical protein